MQFSFQWLDNFEISICLHSTISGITDFCQQELFVNKPRLEKCQDTRKIKSLKFAYYNNS